MQGERLSLVYSRAGGCLNEAADGNLGNFAASVTAATVTLAANELLTGQGMKNSLSKEKATDRLLLEMKVLEDHTSCKANLKKKYIIVYGLISKRQESKATGKAVHAAARFADTELPWLPA